MKTITRSFTAAAVTGTSAEKNLQTFKSPAFKVTETLPENQNDWVKLGWSPSGVCKAIKQQTQIEYRPSVSKAYFAGITVADCSQDSSGNWIVSNEAVHAAGIARAIVALADWKASDVKEATGGKPPVAQTEVDAMLAVATAFGADNVVSAILSMKSGKVSKEIFDTIELFRDYALVEIEKQIGQLSGAVPITKKL